MRRRFAALLALLLLLSLALTACSGESELEEQEEEPWYTLDPEQEEEEQETAWITSFALAWHQGQTLDPITCADGIQRYVASLLYEPLLSWMGPSSPKAACVTTTPSARTASPGRCTSAAA